MLHWVNIVDSMKQHCMPLVEKYLLTKSVNDHPMCTQCGSLSLQCLLKEAFFTENISLGSRCSPHFKSFEIRIHNFDFFTRWTPSGQTSWTAHPSSLWPFFFLPHEISALKFRMAASATLRWRHRKQKFRRKLRLGRDWSKSRPKKVAVLFGRPRKDCREIYFGRRRFTTEPTHLKWSY